MMRPILLTLALALLLAGAAAAAPKSLTLTVRAGERDRVNTPVRVELLLTQEQAKARSVTLTGPKGERIAAQRTRLSLRSFLSLAVPGHRVGSELHFILPKLKAGETATFTATFSDSAPREGFAWHDTPGESAELRWQDRPVLRYMYRALDESSPEAREQTYKVFHHLFDPTGTRLVTKGPGGRFTHHRGLFYGFNRITYGDGKRADVWHASGDAHQSHARTLAVEAGPVLGRHTVVIDWHGVGKEVFAREVRQVTVYRVPGGNLVEFASELRTADGKVILDGDPQHAGFHFRADDEVAGRTAKQTYYLRPDGPGKPGETRNWPQDRGHVNLPWNAMSFVLGDRRYTVAYLDHPDNPKEARFSERDYGRFGSYFEYTLDKNKPLTVNYRVWLQEGEMTVPEVAAKSADFVDPVGVWVKS